VNSAAVDLFTHPSAEDWLVQRLEELGHPIDADRSIALKDRIRAAITSAGIACLIAGRGPGGKGVEDLEAAFARIFGEQLAPAAPRKSRSSQRKAQP